MTMTDQKLQVYPAGGTTKLGGLRCIESGSEVKENKSYYLALVYGTYNVIVYY